MGSQQRTGPPVLVPLAAEIDMSNCEQVCDQLSVAFIGGAPVVIADFTLTTFCDCATLRRLLDIQRQAAAASHAELRVAVPLVSPVRRIMHMTGLDEQFQLYPTAAHAAAAFPALVPRIPAPPNPGGVLKGYRRAREEEPAMPDRVTSPLAPVVELTGISRHVPVYPTLQQAAHGSPPSG